jgi:DNA-directed RNA polymerase subunit M/transcription elongation factor TFIIS
MPRYCPRCGEALHTHSTTKGERREGAMIGSRLAYDDTPSKIKKAKRKPSAYNKRYSAEYKRQAKKHPRLKFAALSKRTHKALRRKK